jgi:hypothetical protein
MKKALLFTTLIFASSTSIAQADTYVSVDSNGNVTNSIVCDASVCGSSGSWHGVGPDGNKLVLQSINSNSGFISQQDKQVNYSQNTNSFTVVATLPQDNAAIVTNNNSQPTVVETAAPIKVVQKLNPIVTTTVIQAPPQDVIKPNVDVVVVSSATVLNQPILIGQPVNCTDPANYTDISCLFAGSTDPVPYDISKNPIPIDPFVLSNPAFDYVIKNTQLTIQSIIQQATINKLNRIQGRGVVYL